MEKEPTRIIVMGADHPGKTTLDSILSDKRDGGYVAITPQEATKEGLNIEEIIKAANTMIIEAPPILASHLPFGSVKCGKKRRRERRAAERRKKRGI